jgi:hypothetical protein
VRTLWETTFHLAPEGREAKSFSPRYKLHKSFVINPLRELPRAAFKPVEMAIISGVMTETNQKRCRVA